MEGRNESVCLIGDVCLLGDGFCVQHVTVAAVLVLHWAVVLLVFDCDLLCPGEGGSALRQCLIRFPLSVLSSLNKIFAY